MPIRNYGVWVAEPVSFVAPPRNTPDRSPHIELKFTDSKNGRQYRAAINVASTDIDSRLVYWTDKDFKHPIIEKLRDLPQGFQRIDQGNDSQELRLDYDHTEPTLLHLTKGKIVPFDKEGADNDILDFLVPVLEDAIALPDTRIFIFGSSFGSGIHDVHMNQGSLPRYANGIGQDGAMMFYFPADQHFEAVFLAFASQRLPSDPRTGAGMSSSKTLAETIGEDDDVQPQISVAQEAQISASL